MTAEPSPHLRTDFLGKPPPPQFLAPASWPPAFTEVYREILDTLDDAGVRYLLGGAFALNVHTGVWRDTKDLDTFMPVEEVDRALETLDAAGFGTETVYPEWLSRAYRGDVFVDVIHRNANALVPVDETWFEHATVADVLGRRRFVLGPEHLVWSKIYVLARNRCDVADVGHVLYRRDVDWDLLGSLVGDDAAELLLAHLHVFRWTYPEAADRVPEAFLDALRARAARGGGRFRGTLLDTVSYRVDVAAWGLPDAQAEARGDALAERIRLDRVTGGSDKDT